MPNTPSATEHVGRRHNCAGFTSKRDAEGCCEECGAQLDEQGYEIVAQEGEAKGRASLKSEPTFEDALAETQDPRLREIIERMTAREERRHGEPSPK